MKLSVFSVTIAALLATGAAEAKSPVECSAHRIPVSIPSSDARAEAHEMAATLCTRSPRAARTIQVLVHGGTYDGRYWDFGFEPETYSYVRRANEAGYATLAIDRLGHGESTRPPAASLTIDNHAATVHQVVQALRAGEVDGVAYDTVLLVGHSIGSGVAVVAAAEYGDVDGVVVSGALHLQGYITPLVLASLMPAQLEPRFADAPLGYLTTRPGTRGQNFYFEPGADPAVIAHDEATKDTVVPNEPGDLQDAMMRSAEIDVPVLSVIGEKDSLFCSPAGCSGPLGNQAFEPAFYAPEAELELVVIPETGHNLNLHLRAQDFFDVAEDWTDRRFGPCASSAISCR